MPDKAPYDNEATRINLSRYGDGRLEAEIEYVMAKAKPNADDRAWLTALRAERERRKER